MKKLFFLVFVGLLALILCACVGSDAPADTTAEGQAFSQLLPRVASRSFSPATRSMTPIRLRRSIRGIRHRG